MGTEAVWVPLVMAAVSYGANEYNTQRVEHKQDQALADNIRNQAGKQKQADQRVDKTVAELEASTANDDRQKRLGDYMQTIQRSKGAMTNGLAPAVGGDAFKADSAQAAKDVQANAAQDAGLLARIDAPGLQRQREGFGFGNLATDIGLIDRQAKGQSFLDELRLRGIRRNPWVDLAGSVAGAYGNGYGAGTTGGTGGGGGKASSGGPTRRYGTGPE